MAPLVDPLELPYGLRVRNRIAKAALSEALGDAGNSPDERIVNLYLRALGCVADVRDRAFWRPVSSMRGLIGPALDSRFSRDRRILDVLARLEARLSTSPSATPAAPSRRKKS